MNVLVRSAGLLLLFSGCVLAGIETEKQMKWQWKFWMELQEVLNYLGKEMAYHRTVLPDALLECANGRSSNIHKLCENLSAAIRKCDGRSLEEIWKEELEKELWFCTGKMRTVIWEEMAEAICAPDLIMQKILLDRCIHHLEEEQKQAYERWQEKGKLYRRLWMTSGAFLVIFLI